MRIRALLVAFTVAAAGCGSAGLSTNDGGAGTDGGGTPPPPDLGGLRVVSASIGPIDLDPGGETTVCTIFHLPLETDVDVVRIDANLAPGSHHLILYKSNETAEQLVPKKCEFLIDGLLSEVQGGTPKEIPLYIAETQDQNALQLPAGVAYRFAAHQMIALEAHYINATPNPLHGMGTVHLTIGEAAQTHIPADIMFCGSVSELTQFTGGKGIPPGMSSLKPQIYRPPMGSKVFGLTTHQHKRGTLMTLSKSTDANDAGTLLVNGQPWDNEPFVTYDDEHLLTFGPNEGIRWECFYDNPDPQNIFFGQSAEKNEMCFFWAYYFPSVGHLISFPDCIR